MLHSERTVRFGARWPTLPRILSAPDQGSWHRRSKEPAPTPLLRLRCRAETSALFTRKCPRPALAAPQGLSRGVLSNRKSPRFRCCRAGGPRCPRLRGATKEKARFHPGRSQGNAVAYGLAASTDPWRCRRGSSRSSTAAMASSGNHFLSGSTRRCERLPYESWSRVGGSLRQYPD